MVNQYFWEYAGSSYQGEEIQTEIVVNAAIQQLVVQIGNYKLLFSLDLHVPYATTLEALYVSLQGQFAVALNQDIPAVLEDGQKKKIRSTGQVEKLNADELYRIWNWVSLGYSFDDPAFRIATLKRYEELSCTYPPGMGLWGLLAYEGTVLEVLTGFNLYLYGLVEGHFSQKTSEALLSYLRLRADRGPERSTSAIYKRLWDEALLKPYEGIVFKLQRCISELFDEGMVDDLNFEAGSVIVLGKQGQNYHLALPKKLKSPIRLCQKKESSNIIILKGEVKERKVEKIKVSKQKDGSTTPAKAPVIPMSPAPSPVASIVIEEKKSVGVAKPPVQKVVTSPPTVTILRRGAALPEGGKTAPPQPSSYQEAFSTKQTPSWLGRERLNNTNADYKPPVYTPPIPSWKKEIKAPSPWQKKGVTYRSPQGPSTPLHKANQPREEKPFFSEGLSASGQCSTKVAPQEAYPPLKPFKKMEEKAPVTLQGPKSPSREKSESQSRLSYREILLQEKKPISTEDQNEYPPLKSPQQGKTLVPSQNLARVKKGIPLAQAPKLLKGVFDQYLQRTPDIDPNLSWGDIPLDEDDE